MIRTAVYCGTRNLYHQIATVAKSIIMHDGADRVCVLAEDNTLGEPLPDCFRVINVSDQQYFPRDGPNYNSNFTYMALMRTALTKILSDDIVLSLDADTIVHGDVRGLFDTDMTGHYLAAVPEPPSVSEAARDFLGVYYNSGVLLMNLALLRDGTDDCLINTLNEKQFRWPEQDAMNIVCRDRIKPLPPRYNVIRFFYPDIPKADVIIRHYVHNIPPIEHEFAYRKLERMTWDYVLSQKEKR